MNEAAEINFARLYSYTIHQIRHALRLGLVTASTLPIAGAEAAGALVQQSSEG
jgi:hypothetical protein